MNFLALNFLIFILVVVVVIQTTIMGAPTFEERSSAEEEEAYKALYGASDMKSPPRNKFGKVTSQGIVPWPNGQLIYKIRSGVYTSAQITVIKDAMSAISSYTSNCLSFKEQTNERNYVDIFSGSGCWSSVGMIGQAQQLSLLSNGCIYKGTVMHEFLHAFGFFHEQTRADRDQYINVFYDNIDSTMAHNYDIVDNSIQYGIPYDYQSIMHYGSYAFAKDRNKPAMTPKQSGVTLQEPYNKNVLTTNDIAMIKKFYNCENEIISPRVTNWGDWCEWESCDSGTYVYGYRLKSESPQGSGDDTALNEIELICNKNDKLINGKEGIWGSWTDWKKCPSNKRVNGFKINQEPPLGSSRDDTAANDLILYCEDGTELNARDGSTNFGNWSNRLNCPAGKFICGLRVQLENKQGSGDDTALNNVDFKCCN